MSVVCSNAPSSSSLPHTFTLNSLYTPSTDQSSPCSCSCTSKCACCVMMAGLTWILTLMWAGGCHPSSASPVLHSARVVQLGQNVSLPCNLTSTEVITWYLQRTDRLLPLLTWTQSKLREGRGTVELHTANISHFSSGDGLQSGLVSLEIRGVEKDDAGLYFCTGFYEGRVCIDRGIQLTVNAVDAGDRTRQPCWSPGLCVLPALLTLCLVCVVGLCVCSGKPAVCCCKAVRRDTSGRVAEDDYLHYSSLKHPDKPRPSDRGRIRLVKEDVTYSTVASPKSPNGSHDHR